MWIMVIGFNVINSILQEKAVETKAKWLILCSSSFYKPNLHFMLQS